MEKLVIDKETGTSKVLKDGDARRRDRYARERHRAFRLRVRGDHLVRAAVRQLLRATWSAHRQERHGREDQGGHIFCAQHGRRIGKDGTGANHVGVNGIDVDSIAMGRVLR
jgi:hypothetical protein